MKNILLPLYIIGIVSACSPSPESQTESNVAPPSYEYKTFKVSSEKMVKHDQGIDTAYFLSTYPEFADQQINQFVQENLVLDSGKTSLEQMGKEFIDAYEKFYEQAEFKRSWFREETDSVVVQTPSYIGFTSFFYEYMGGAHGNYYTRYYNYDTSTNKEILLDEIIDESRLATLTTIAEGIFRKQENLEDTTSLSENYFFKDDKFALPRNFILQKEGLLFIYSIYEIKPYVSGETKLLIPYSAIDTLLTPYGKQLLEELN